MASVVDTAISSYLDSVATAIPRILTAIVFLCLAAVAIKLVMTVLRQLLRRSIPPEDAALRGFVAIVVGAGLWFATALALLSILGLTAVAASLGTASGFLALGVSYALSGMIADAVSGVYLLRDSDFEVGDRVTTAGLTGQVEAIHVRKTRLAVEGDTVIVANKDVESRWRKHTPVDAADDGDLEATEDGQRDGDGQHD